MKTRKLFLTASMSKRQFFWWCLLRLLFGIIEEKQWRTTILKSFCIFWNVSSFLRNWKKNTHKSKKKNICKKKPPAGLGYPFGESASESKASSFEEDGSWEFANCGRMGWSVPGGFGRGFQTSPKISWICDETLGGWKTSQHRFLPNAGEFKGDESHGSKKSP